MSMTDNEIIEQAIEISGLNNYTDRFNRLGGGELNNTYVLELVDNKVVLRIAKHKDQNSLFREANVLRILNLPNQIPQLIYFDQNSKIDERSWIVESFIKGQSVERLNLQQFNSLGKLLAKVHEANRQSKELQLWDKFLQACKTFGDESYLLSHPDSNLRQLIKVAHDQLFPSFQLKLENIELTLIHGDATPSNVLVSDTSVGLIDWELSSLSDPMAEFSTIYYEDIDYNKGKWRLKIKPEEKRELFEGYRSAGGKIDEERIKFWISFDKLGAAVFLYWRINESGREANIKQLEQYQADYSNIISSLEKQFLP